MKERGRNNFNIKYYFFQLISRHIILFLRFEIFIFTKLQRKILRNRRALALFRNKIEIKAIETADSPSQRRHDTTSWFHPLSRPRKKSKYAANATATVLSGIRCDKKRLATGLALFLHSPSSESSTSSHKDKKRSAVEDGIGGKKTSFTKLNWQPRYSNSSRRTSHVGLVYFGQTGQPVSFMNITSDGSRARHQRFFLFFYVSLVNVRRFPPGEVFWDIVYTILNSTVGLTRSFVDFWITY